MEQLTNTELAILGLLAEGHQNGSAKHAYGLEQDINNRGMRAWTEIGFSSIYYVLNKLEEAGLLESSLLDESETGGEMPAPAAGQGRESASRGQARSRRGPARLRRGPARRVYRLAPAGWDAYRAAVYERLAHPRPRTADFELGLANLIALPPEQARAALETYRTDLRERIAGVGAKQQADREQAEGVGAFFPPHVTALFERSLHLMQAELDWIEGYLSQADRPGNHKDASDEHVTAH